MTSPAGMVGPLEVEEGVLEADGADLSSVSAGVEVVYHLPEGVVDVGDYVLVQVDHQDVPVLVHVPVQTVVQRCKQTLCTDLFLRYKWEAPW